MPRGKGKPSAKAKSTPSRARKAFAAASSTEGEAAAALGTGGQDKGPELEITTSRQFESWLAERNITLAFTTYQAGKLFFVGLNRDNRLAIFNRTLERCMGLAYAANSLWVAGLYQIYKFVDVMAGQAASREGYDALFVPQAAYYTGDLDTHDLGVGRDGRLYFVNTLFSCIASLSDTHSFKPVWRPSFVDRLAAEDRCHLNGMALNRGVPVIATAAAETNIADGWRDHRDTGGVVIDVKSGKSIITGLSMPHSPRIYRNALWLHNSGTGHFGRADLDKGTFEPLAFCPGYLRGLDFVDGHAIVGLSKPRKDKTFGGLALDDNLAREKVEARCGLYVIDLASGDIVHWLRLEGMIEELYDVAVLPGRRNTAAIGFRTDEIRRVISIET
ncbi:MAG: TIGR03032 family protein [Methyloligellaceae bacterium]